MKQFVLGLVVSLAAAAGLLCQSTIHGISLAAAERAPEDPATPSPRLGPDGEVRASFIKSHENFVKIAKKGNIDLLFLGDSITAGWANNKQIWDKHFGAWRSVNLGHSGDRTQHLLWRITNGALDGINPQVVVLMIGTNNAESDSADGIARGITKIVQVIRAELPETVVLLLGVFPRGDTPNPTRTKLQQVNEIVATLADGRFVHYLDIGQKFLAPDGALSSRIMPDFLHLSTQGYAIWADAITPKLVELMTKRVTDSVRE